MLHGWINIKLSSNRYFFYKKKIISLLVIFVLFFATCKIPDPDHPTSTTSKASSDKSELFISNEDSLHYAQNFSIYKVGDHKVAHIHYQSDNRNLRFDQKIIFCNDKDRSCTIPDILSDAWIVNTPIQTIAANEDGEITRIKTLGLSDRIIAMGGGGIYDPYLRKRWEDKEIASIGYSFHRPTQPEVILDLGPDVLMLHTVNHGRMTALLKMRNLGINAIPQFAWAEESFLGRAEWLKFTSLFFEREEEARVILDSIVQRCEYLTQLVESKKEKVKAFITYFPSGDSDWSVHRNDFYASYLDASGVTNVLKDNGPTHSVGMNNETLLSLAKDADYWIVNSTSDDNWPPNGYLNNFKAYRNQEIYHYQKRTRYEHDAYDWYETPEVRPDLVLEDLISIFYPELLPDHELYFFEKIAFRNSDSS